MITRFVIAAVLALVAPSYGQTQSAPPEGAPPDSASPDSAATDRQVNIGTHSLYVHCVGKGIPVVVIDVGVGESYTGWQQIQDALAQVTRVFAYDRAGYGQSDPGPMPRNARQEAGELRLLLRNAGVEGPYLLVGHSLGGLNMQVFAAEYPDEVAGMVLLDPPPLQWITGAQTFAGLDEMFKQQTQELSAAAEAMSQSADPQERAKAVYLKAVASEHGELFGESAREVAAIDSFGDLPLTVIASGKPNPLFGEAAEDFQEFWIEQSRELAGKSTRGKFVLIEESTHHLNTDAPDKVAEVIRSMMGEISGASR
jgi:pimeloyl-ACP methyl ester carboxylesterase